MTKQLSYLLAFLKFTHIVDFMIMMPLAPQLDRLWGITPEAFGLLVAAYTFSAGIVGLLGSLFMDRLDRKHALLVLYAGFLMGTLACAFADSYATLLLARCVTGAFGGLLHAMVLSIASDLTPLERRGESIGIIMSAFSAASVFGVPFSLLMASEFGWQAPFLFLGLIGIPALLACVWMIPNVRGHLGQRQPKPLKRLFEMLTQPEAVRAHLLITLLMLGQFSVITFLAPYMVSNVGFSEHQLAYIYFAGGFITLFSSPWFGKLTDRYGALRLFTVATLASLIPLWIITNLPRVEIAVVIIVTSSMFILITGRVIPAMTMITSSVQKEKRGGFMSVNGAIQQIASGMASYVAGLLVVKSATGEYQDYDLVGYLAITASILAIFVARRLRVVRE